jgi:radical SAM superfamily enzyme YgiQ (UPF0313 family)
MLIKPPLNKTSIIGDSLIEPLELEILAATVSQYPCRILDMRIDTDLKGALWEFRPDLVGITAYTTEVPMVRGLIRKVKTLAPSAFTVVGGCHASVVPGDFFASGVDAVAVGNGEALFPDLVNALARRGDLSQVPGLWLRSMDRYAYTGDPPPLKDLDKLSPPARWLTQSYRHRYFFGRNRPAAAIMTSRGCPFRCTFCSIWKMMNGKYLVRNADKVVEELSEITERYVFIADDNTLSHARHAGSLAAAIERAGLRKRYKMYGRADAIVSRPHIVEQWRSVGLQTVIMGLESFQDKRLSGFNKGSTVDLQNRAIEILKANRIRVRAYFIVDPDFTRDDFRALLDYVEREEITEPMFSILTPLPGTDLFEQSRERLVLDRHELFDLVHAMLPTRLPRREFYAEFSRLYRKSYPLKKILGINGAPLRAGRLVGGGLAYLKMRAITRRMGHAYRIEEKIHAETRTDQPGVQHEAGYPAAKNHAVPAPGAGLSRCHDSAGLDRDPGG